jgi:hypothetical protein
MGVLNVLGTTVILNTHRTEPVGPVGQFVIVLFCLGIGGMIALVGAGYVQTYNRVRKTDPVDVRRLTDTDSEVELAGTAHAHEETSQSPLTDTECIAYDWEVERYLGGGRGSNWSTIASGETRHPCRLDDGTGIALVDPNGATLELLTEETIEVEPYESPPPEVGDYLERTETVDREHDYTRRYTETRLEPGDDIHVLGPVRRLAHSVEMPGDADAVIGVSDPDRGFTVGEDGLSKLVDQIKTDTMRFMITTGDEREAERHLLTKGLFIAGFGIVFALLPVVFVVAL